MDSHDPKSTQFPAWLQDIGEGKDLLLDHTFSLLQHMVSNPAVSDLIHNIYPGIARPSQDNYFLERGILCPRNIEVNDINSLVFRGFPGEEQIFHCADSIEGSEDGDHYPVEYLNSIEMGSLPPAQFQVKPGVPLMLLRNLDQRQGL